MTVGDISSTTVRKRDIVRLLFHRPGELIAIFYWFVRRRRVRAVGRLRTAVAALPFIYTHWLQDCANVDRRALLSCSGPERPARAMGIHLHVGIEVAPRRVRAVIASVLRQSWPHWKLTVTLEDAHIYRLPSDPRISVIDGCRSRTAGLAAAFDASDTRYLVPLREDCRLPVHALAAYAAASAAMADAVPPILYGDQDEFGFMGRRTNPWFKPDWDPNMAMAQDYVSAACAIPVDAARIVLRDEHWGMLTDEADGAAVYALLLHLAVRNAHDCHHAHRVTMTTPRGDWYRPRADRFVALRAHLASYGGPSVTKGPFETAKIAWPLPVRHPLVSIIIPTRDGVDLLRCCVEGVLDNTRYDNMQIIIVDNGSIEKETLEFLQSVVADERVEVISWPNEYNYSAINNFAASFATGEYLCLLNNDIEIIDENWLEEMMRQACRPGIGAVGARLLYPDRTIQHAGIVLGMGNAAGHAHRGIADDEPGYFAHALVTRCATAVTAACLVVSRRLFDSVGGLDQDGVRIAYSDVDFCLKIRATGAKNMYVASAVLIHHESKSRGLDMAPNHRDRYFRELAILQERWGTVGFLDPTHHPALDRHSEQFGTV